MGPMSVSLSTPLPSRSALTRFSSSGSHSLACPTKTQTLIAMHRWPAAPKAAPMMPLKALSRSASGSTTAWFLAPMLHWHLFPLAVDRSYTCFPMAPEPTNDTARTAGWSQRKLTASLPPCRMLKMPGGSPAFVASLASIKLAVGTLSDGFSTNALPVATATGIIHRGIIAGKLNGAIPATTPSGCFIVTVSMFRLICSSASPIM
mmetsp:Transcript_41218/g.80570  ORF Transcript_41218/g.80570 Transcript_41218/m.80570 type:complete len:205 (-) Transcript_41218:394-1008(-)